LGQSGQNFTGLSMHLVLNLKEIGGPIALALGNTIHYQPVLCNSYLTGMLMLFPNNQDEAFHRNRIFRGLLEGLGTMPVFVDQGMVCTVVIVQSRLVENDGDGFTTLHIVRPANTIDANLPRIERCWHVRYERHEMGSVSRL
jgi:hypothetical protein